MSVNVKQHAIPVEIGITTNPKAVIDNVTEPEVVAMITGTTKRKTIERFWNSR